MRELRPIYLGDALFSSQPMCASVLAQGGDFLFVCKEDSRKTLYEFLRSTEPERHTVSERRMGGRTRSYRYSWVKNVPLRDGKDALNAHWLGVEVVDQAGKTTYRSAFVTSLSITPENVAEIVTCARAHWKTRKRELQRVEEPWLSSGAQLREWQTASGAAVCAVESAGVCLSYGV
jgi:hypothetical protein